MTAVLCIGGALVIGAPRSESGSSSAPPSRPAAPAPSPLDLPSTSPAPVGDETASIAAAEAAVTALVGASNEIMQRADGTSAGLESIAVGAAWGELQSLAVERSQLGYRQVGEATVTSSAATAVDLVGPPPTVELEVCIDSSAVDVVDASGRSLKDLLYDPDGAVLNVYIAQYIDGLWKIVSHDIPDGARC